MLRLLVRPCCASSAVVADAAKLLRIGGKIGCRGCLKRTCWLAICLFGMLALDVKRTRS